MDPYQRERQVLRARMLRRLHRERPAALRAGRPLGQDERSLLEAAQANGGSLSIGGKPVAELVRVASVALVLEQRGLLCTAIRFSEGVPIRPEAIAIELTEAGARSLQVDWSG